jgi:hypothetical protein
MVLTGNACHYNDFDAVIDFEPFGVRRIPDIYKRPYSYIKRMQYVLKDAERVIKGKFGLSLYDYETRYKRLRSLKEFPLLYPAVTPNGIIPQG